MCFFCNWANPLHVFVSSTTHTYLHVAWYVVATVFARMQVRKSPTTKMCYASRALTLHSKWVELYQFDNVRDLKWLLFINHLLSQSDFVIPLSHFSSEKEATMNYWIINNTETRKRFSFSPVRRNNYRVNDNCFTCIWVEFCVIQLPGNQPLSPLNPQRSGMAPSFHCLLNSKPPSSNSCNFSSIAI